MRGCYISSKRMRGDMNQVPKLSVNERSMTKKSTEESKKFRKKVA